MSTISVRMSRMLDADLKDSVRMPSGQSALSEHLISGDEKLDCQENK